MTNGTYTIGRPITVNVTAGAATLGTLDPQRDSSTFTGVLELNGSNGVALSTAAGGTASFSGNITGTGTGTLAVPMPSNIVFSGSNTSAAPTRVSGGTLTLSGGTLGGTGATTVNSGLLYLNNGTIDSTARPP